MTDTPLTDKFIADFAERYNNWLANNPSRPYDHTASTGLDEFARDLERQLAAARRDALEEAIEACKKVWETWGDDAQVKCIVAIRALQSEPPAQPKEG